MQPYNPPSPYYGPTFASPGSPLEGYGLPMQYEYPIAANSGGADAVFKNFGVMGTTDEAS